jgi:hypothetical protein
MRTQKQQQEIVERALRPVEKPDPQVSENCIVRAEAVQIRAELATADTLSRIREAWRQLFGIDIEAKRRAAKLSSLEDHLADNTRPTPLADALLSEIAAIPRTKKIHESREPDGSYVESTEPGVAPGDVFRIFGNDAQTILTDENWAEVNEADRQAIGQEAMGWARVAPKEWCRAKKSTSLMCSDCGDDPHAKVVRRTYANGKWDFMCHKCGRTVKP